MFFLYLDIGKKINPLKTLDIMTKNNVNRMDIYSVAAFFFNKGMRQTGHYILSCQPDVVTLDGKWIEAAFVERHAGLGSALWKELQSKVTTWMPLQTENHEHGNCE